MKKKLFISIAAIFVLIAVLTVPIPLAPHNDGGTREYSALTYKVVSWNRLTEDGVYKSLRLYFGKERSMSVDELWETEKSNSEKKFLATITELRNDGAVVAPLRCEAELALAAKITFNIEKLESIGAEVGSLVEISYVGDISSASVPEINATSWRVPVASRDSAFGEFWIDASRAEKLSDNSLEAIVTDIYSDCFFVGFPEQTAYKMKVNGVLPAGFCIGDKILCSYKDAYLDKTSNRAEAQLVSVKLNGMEFDTSVVYKPVIYLYPEEDTEIYVELNLMGELVCTYPTYENGWTVTASPDGTLRDENGQIYNYLYWEGDIIAEYDMTKGFCVKGEDTAKFLEYALAKLGLNRREANEFIVYWLPLMQNNPYNVISFQTSAYTDAAELIVDPYPDTVIRVFMAWEASEEYVELEEQDLTSTERLGFTVVEWGGTEIK